MLIERFRSAVKEAERFLEKAKALEKPAKASEALAKKEGTYYRSKECPPGKVQAAAKRASMDLSSALALMRKSHSLEDHREWLAKQKEKADEASGQG